MRRGIVELPLAASRDSRVPLAAQITGQLRAALTEGRLAAGERLRPSRALAGELGVSRTVINSAYAQLFAEGWIEGRHGSGTYVADGAPGTPQATAAQPDAAGPVRVWPGPAAGHRAGRPAGPATGSAALIDLRPGIPWMAGIDQAAWRRAWRTAGLQAPARRRPARAYRAARRPHRLPAASRGIQCAPEEVLVTRGIAGGLGLIAATVLRPGDRAGVEEPGYPVARDVLAAHGVQVVPCPVDADGLLVGELRRAET